MRAPLAVLAIAVGGCTQILGIDALQGKTDAGMITPDVPADTSAPPQSVKVTGKVQATDGPAGMQGLASAIVEFHTPNAAMLANTTTDNLGNYALTVTSGGGPVDGYVLVHHPQVIDAEMHLAAPTAVDITVDIPAFSQNGLLQLANSAGAPFGTPLDSLLVIGIADRMKMAVPGAQAHIAGLAPNELICYTSPLVNQVHCNDPAAIQTGSDGLAYAFGIRTDATTPRELTVDASKPGINYGPRTIKLVNQVVVFLPIAERDP